MTDRYTEIIIGQLAIINSLCTLIDSKTLFKIQIPETKFSGITMLLDIKEINGSYCLLMDRISGFENALANAPNKTVSLESLVEIGTPYQFQAQVVESRPREVLLELPGSINRIQKRRHIRADALLGTTLTFHIGSSNKLERAEVKDYSPGGVAFYAEKTMDLKMGDPLNELHLMTPQGTQWLDFPIPQAVVRGIEPPASPGERTLCAVEFTKISEDIRNQIFTLIFKQEKILVQRFRKEDTGKDTK